jgi:hypothetical protein
MAPPETPSPPPPSARPRRQALVTTLVVIASILSLLSILAVWANRQVLNTDNWASSSSRLLESKAIRSQVAAYLVDQLYQKVNVQAELAKALPKQAQPLAGPAAGGLRNLAEQGIEALLQRPQVQALWESANRAAHKQLLKVLEGGGGALSTQGGVVKLDLGVVLKQVAQGIGVGQNLVNKLPPGAAQITILKSHQLKTAQDAVEILKGAAIVLVLLTLALFVTAVAIAGRRREALRSVGIGLVAAGVAALVVRTLAGTAIVDSLAKTDAQRPAIEDVWSIGTSQLVEAATATIAYGVVIVLAAWLAGPTHTAVRVRRWMAPYLRDPRYAYGALGALLVLIVLWGPTPATRNILLLLVMAAALAGGVEVLRRRTAREFPEATLAGAGASRGEWIEKVRESVSGLAARRRGGRRGGGLSEMERLEALERLARLRDSGVLDESEFELEKRRILGDDPPSGEAA